MYVNHPYERTDKIISSHLARGVRGNMFHVKVLATCEMYALCRFHPFMGHKGPQGEQGYSCTVFSTSVLERISVTPRPRLTPGKDPVPIVQEAGWASGPVWTGAENLAATRIPGPSSPQAVAIPTTLPGPHVCVMLNNIPCSTFDCLNKIKSKKIYILWLFF